LPEDKKSCNKSDWPKPRKKAHNVSPNGKRVPKKLGIVASQSDANRSIHSSNVKNRLLQFALVQMN
jgi:hypothetical protein